MGLEARVASLVQEGALTLRRNDREREGERLPGKICAGRGNESGGAGQYVLHLPKICGYCRWKQKTLRGDIEENKLKEIFSKQKGNLRREVGAMDNRGIPLCSCHFLRKIRKIFSCRIQFSAIIGWKKLKCYLLLFVERKERWKWICVGVNSWGGHKTRDAVLERMKTQNSPQWSIHTQTKEKQK